MKEPKVFKGTQASRSRARFKDTEREIAKCLSEMFSTSETHPSPVFRIPILGREGPDITINEVGMVIDVKSRKVIPDYMFAPANTAIYVGDFVGFRLEDLPNINRFDSSEIKSMSNVVLKWWKHMDDWTQKFHPGITTIILHRSRMPIGHATVIIHQKDRSELCKQLFN
jgi:hypothetical protein